MKYFKNSIIALSTPNGIGGIGIIRISGNKIFNILEKLCNKKVKNLKPRHSYYTYFKNKEEILDYGILIYYNSPFSYTGENIIEIQCHSNPIIINKIINTCLFLGSNSKLKIAKRGEFTKRAFLNKKINLIQVKSIIDLINSSNYLSNKIFLNFYCNNFKKKIKYILNKIIKLRIIIESNIIFLNNKLNINIKKIYNYLYIIKKSIKKLLFKINNNNNNNNLNIIIIGRTNMGKSSLMNILSKSKVSIVTSISGTTIDKIKNSIFFKNNLINLIDTAGIKKKIYNKIERISIKKSWKEIKKSNIILYLFESYKGLLKKDYYIINKLPKKKIIFIGNKIDLIKYKPFIKKFNNNKIIYISVKNKKGINLIKNEINNIINNNNINNNIINKNYFYNIKNSYKIIKKIILFIINKKYNIRNDLIIQKIYILQNNFNKIFGKFTNEKLLNKIFSKFCIGK
ncbi:tRNA modification GTPase mnmE (trmE) [Candidatus Zinderia insecticola CARI]|uniref:tRNA modification GTPase MnmE n=1 Tax=Zinderia insecticola (strain CARI) TaxID=871271 RepID=E0TIK9_ZINIC|nr:tRNA modification GTPase mnmE (trmE) [Candidatus Zinderia insecticola CARI]